MPDFLVQLKLDSLTKIEFVNKIVNAKRLGTYHFFVGELLMFAGPWHHASLFGCRACSGAGGCLGIEVLSQS